MYNKQVAKQIDKAIIKANEMLVRPESYRTTPYWLENTDSACSTFSKKLKTIIGNLDVFMVLIQGC